MSEVPEELKYTHTHEWAQKEDEDLITIGITDHAQSLLGDVVYVELPEVGAKLEYGQECAVVESVKTASDIFSPFSGEVIEVNEELMSNPALINNDAYQEGWILKLRPDDLTQWDELLDAKTYADKIENE